jgi:hypothetical protein
MGILLREMLFVLHLAHFKQIVSKMFVNFPKLFRKQPKCLDIPHAVFVYLIKRKQLQEQYSVEIQI